MTFLLLWSLRASAILAIGLLLALALRHRSAATRNLVLRIALVAAWLVPLAAFVAPRVEVPLPTPILAPAAAPPIVGRTIAEPTSVQEGWSVVQSDPHDVSTLGFKRQTALSSAWVPAVGPFLLLWSGGAGLLVLRWLVGLGRLRRLRRNATLTGEPEVWRAAIAVPATYGRTILMPLASEEWPEARVLAAILHERAHLRRRDWHWQALAGLFVALHWPNPLAWILARALRNTAEAAADDEALALMRPSDYARELLAVAASVGPAGPALAMARRGGVVDRVTAILADRERRRPTRLAAALILLSILSAGLAVAGIQTQRRNSASGQTGPLVSLLDIREVAPHPSLRWDAQGRTVPTPHDVAQRYYVPGLADRDPGERLLEVRFALREPANLRHFALSLASTDSHVTFQMRPVGKQSVLEAIVYAPEKRANVSFRIGQGVGSWQVVPIQPKGFVVRPSTRWEGTRASWLDVEWPRALEGTDTRFEIRDTAGHLIPYGSIASRTRSGKTILSYELESTRTPARIALWTRPYAWTTIQVPLVRPTPHKKVSLQSVATRFSQLPFGRTRTAELVSLFDASEAGGPAWHPDGTPTSRGIEPQDRSGDLPGFRRLGFSVRIQGPTIRNAYFQTSGYAGYGTGLGYPDQMGDDKPTQSRVIGSDFPVPQSVARGDIRLDLIEGPSTLHFVTRRNDLFHVNVGRAKAGKDSLVNVTFPRTLRVPADRLAVVLAYDASGRVLSTSDDRLRTVGSQIRIVKMWLPHPERVARWEVRSRRFSTVTFKDVAYRPNP